MTVELRIVFPHPAIPNNQRNEAGVCFHFENASYSNSHFPVFAFRSLIVLLYFFDESSMDSQARTFAACSSGVLCKLNGYP